MKLLCRLLSHKRRRWMEVHFVDGSVSVVTDGVQVVSASDPVKARWWEGCRRCGARLSEGAWTYAECKVHGKIGGTDDEVRAHFLLPHMDERSQAERRFWQERNVVHWSGPQ